MEKIKRAIISVHDKTGIVDLARHLIEQGVQIISSGGTQKELESAGIKTEKVSEVTGFPEILNGRVKTLHPTIFAGILARRDPSHLGELKKQNIDPIDLIVVNLYPFEQTIARPDCTFEEAVENIDIGGPSLIRAAAKNLAWTTVITNPDQYDGLISEMNSHQGNTTEEFRRLCAIRAFEHTARYNALIAHYLRSGAEEIQDLSEEFTLAGKKISDLRYGENPHQRAAYYSFSTTKPLKNFEQLHGKDLSYNNLLDLDAALSIVSDFDENFVVILKHTNPCGAAWGESIEEAYTMALDTDSLSAYGGIVGLTKTVDGQLARIMSEHFFECILAPAFSDEALTILTKKKNLRLLTFQQELSDTWNYQVRTINGGFLVQGQDSGRTEVRNARVVSKRQPTDQEWQAMAFAWKLVKHVHSNAIIYTTDKQLIGVGAGQMSRVDAAELAVKKAEQSHHSTHGTVCASDAYFPFKDGIEALAAAGITAVIQPGGSIRDEEVIQSADEHQLTMVFTAMRHFKH